MMRWIVGTSLKFRFIVLAIAGLMMLSGVGQLRDVPDDVFMLDLDVAWPESGSPRVHFGMGVTF